MNFTELADVLGLGGDALVAHSLRVSQLTFILARAGGLGRELAGRIARGAFFHDIGMLVIPEAIRLKPGRLDSLEFSVVKLHPEIGYRLIPPSSDPVTITSRKIALCHHERWDGSGYPYGLAGEEIPVEARWTALADHYDALRSERPYKSAYSHEKSVRILTQGDGRTLPSHFAPEVLKAFSRAHGSMESARSDNGTFVGLRTSETKPPSRPEPPREAKSGEGKHPGESSRSPGASCGFARVRLLEGEVGPEEEISQSLGRQAFTS